MFNGSSAALKSVVDNPALRLRNLVRNTTSTSERNEKITIRALTFAERKTIQTLSGIVLDADYKFTLDKSAVNNILKQGRLDEGEIKLTPKDLELIPEVLDKPMILRQLVKISLVWKYSFS